MNFLSYSYTQPLLVLEIFSSYKSAIERGIQTVVITKGGKLKELGFVQFQKSAWLHPYDCRTEIGLLQDFFGLSEEEMQLVVAENISNVEQSKKIFKL